jgi:hypothetical protein
VRAILGFGRWRALYTLAISSSCGARSAGNEKAPVRRSGRGRRQAIVGSRRECSRPNAIPVLASRRRILALARFRSVGLMPLIESNRAVATRDQAAAAARLR